MIAKPENFDPAKMCHVKISPETLDKFITYTWQSKRNNDSKEKHISSSESMFQALLDVFYTKNDPNYASIFLNIICNGSHPSFYVIARFDSYKNALETFNEYAHFKGIRAETAEDDFSISTYIELDFE